MKALALLLLALSPAFAQDRVRKMYEDQLKLVEDESLDPRTSDACRQI